MQPKDIDVKIGSKEQVLWKGVVDRVGEQIAQGKIEAEINETILKLATRRESEEKEKFK